MSELNRLYKTQTELIKLILRRIEFFEKNSGKISQEARVGFMNILNEIKYILQHRDVKNISPLTFADYIDKLHSYFLAIPDELYESYLKLKEDLHDLRGIVHRIRYLERKIGKLI
jgi:hypothetical protein